MKMILGLLARAFRGQKVLQVLAMLLAVLFVWAVALSDASAAVRTVSRTRTVSRVRAQPLVQRQVIQQQVVAGYAVQQQLVAPVYAAPVIAAPIVAQPVYGVQQLQSGGCNVNGQLRQQLNSGGCSQLFRGY